MFIDVLKVGHVLGAVPANSAEYSAEDMELRGLACICLATYISPNPSADEHDMCSIDQVFTWLPQELGLEKGQYAGLIPSLLQTEISYLIKCDAEDVAANQQR